MINSLKRIQKWPISVPMLGFLLSFSGSLPPGAINLAALQVSAGRDVYQGFLFSLGAATLEMLALLAILLGGRLVRVPRRGRQGLRWAQMVLLLLLAAGCFHAAWQAPKSGPQPWLDASVPALVLGLSLRAAMPTMIPFWLGWVTALRARGQLGNSRDYLPYTFAVGIGTLLAHGLYILGGNGIARLATEAHFWVYLLLGLSFLALFAQLLRRNA